MALNDTPWIPAARTNLASEVKMGIPMASAVPKILMSSAPTLLLGLRPAARALTLSGTTRTLLMSVWIMAVSCGPTKPFAVFRATAAWNSLTAVWVITIPRSPICAAT
jgi:hypothetical protein